MYYSGTLFGLVGFEKPTLVSLVVGGTNFAFSAFNILVIDKLGRRKILMVSVIGMVSALGFPKLPTTSTDTLLVHSNGNHSRRLQIHPCLP